MTRARVVAWFGIVLLLVVNIFVWQAIFMRGETLRVSFFNVGKGRAIFIQSPTGTRVLIDSGANRAVLAKLAHSLGPLARNINLVIETNPSIGSVGGMSDVLDLYRVHAFMVPAVANTTAASRMAAAAAGRVHPAHLFPKRGMRIGIGGGAYIAVLSPDRNVSSANPDIGSTVLRLVYGKTSFLFPSDATLGILHWLTELDATSTLRSSVLAVGHKGSADLIDTEWVNSVHPDFLVSSIEDTSYKKLATSTCAALVCTRAKFLTTATSTVIFVSNGRKVMLRS